MAPSAVSDLVSSNSPVQYYSKGLREKFRLDASQLPVTPSEQPYADIGYNIDEAKYLARSKASLLNPKLETTVPNGWPKALSGPLVWTGADFNDEDEFILHLTDADKRELGEALKYFIELELDGNEVNRETFPLPNLGQRLEKAAEDIYDGRGFVIVRGLDPSTVSIEDFTVIYLGISSYIAERRGKQDQRGSMLMHAIEREGDNNHAKPFHTDTVCDCLGLITRSCSAEGGRSILASSWAVYNDLASNRPDLINVIVPFQYYGAVHTQDHLLENPKYGREPAYYKRALMYYHDGRIILNVSRRLLVGAPKYPRTEGIPGLSEAQAEALDALHFTAQKYEIRPTMEKGDMRFVNNLAILHRREAFENEGDRSRHLIRVWLNNETMVWKLPLQLRIAWARVFENDDQERGPFWDIEPPRKDGKVLRIARSCD